MLHRSRIASANDPDGPFPLNNLPCGVFDDGRGARCGVAIGDMILDLGAAAPGGLEGLFAAPSWNAVMAEGPALWARLRAALTETLAEGSETPAPVVAQAGADLLLPFELAEFTDFYASRHHATNVGTMFRGAENALPPNWLSMPIGYNGRASSVVVSGTDIVRPSGQTKAPEDDLPTWGPSRRLDIELEMGAVIGTPSRMGRPVTVAEADAMIFGYVLLNDWSARDIQAWEYQPLGPFQSKAFASSVSPWIVTAEALRPFRVSGPERDRPLLPHLREPGPMLHDIDLEVAMEAGGTEETIARTNARELYYSAAQQVAHHASSGCPMRIGDLIGSGTISGPERHQRGSLLELTWGGAEPIEVGGHARTFIEDGDRLTLRGHAQGDGHRIGFGDCAGRILPAVPHPGA